MIQISTFPLLTFFILVPLVLIGLERDSVIDNIVLYGYLGVEGLAIVVALFAKSHVPPNSTFHHMGSIILPYLVCLIIPLILLKSTENKLEDPAAKPNVWVGFLIMFSGWFMLAWTIDTFRTFGNGTLNPIDSPTEFVAVRAYRYTRNPMITGVCGILLGYAFIYWSPYLLGWAVVFWLIQHIQFLLHEEPVLRERFGKPYIDYCAAVPRWIPRWMPYQPTTQESAGESDERSRLI